MLCAVAALRRQDALAGGLAAMGLGAVVLAVLAPRLTGAVEMGPSGFKLHLVEELADKGEVAGYSDAEIVLALRRILESQDLSNMAHLATSARNDSLDDLRPIEATDDRSTDIPAARRVRQLLKQPGRSGPAEELSAAVGDLRVALASDSRASEELVPLKLLLAQGLLREHYASGYAPLLDEAVTTAREALDLTDPSEPTHDEALAVLATAVNTRYMGTGSMSDLGEAAALLALLDEARRSRSS